MKKIYYLSTCSTCKRIIKDSGLDNGFELQDIKKDPVTAEQLDQMKAMAGSYENLFSRRAQKYRSLGLNEKALDEAAYHKWILEEYTFLKRPVIILDQRIFIGSSPKTLKALKEALANK